MNARNRLSIVVALALAVAWVSPKAGSAERLLKGSPVLDLSVDPQASVHELHRVGINLGSWTAWGAEQLAANVIKNPGFEGVIDRGLDVVSAADSRSLTFAGGQPRPNGFWQGALLNVRSGPLAGETARVIGYRLDPSGARATMTTSPELPLAGGEVVALTKIEDSALPTHWWIPKGQPFCRVGPPRPGSPGQRSFALCPTGAAAAQVNSFLDGIATRAGKLLPINGRWQLSLWCRNAKGSPVLQVSLRRLPSSVLVERRINSSNVWHKWVVDFDGRDSGPAGTLQLNLTASGDGEIDVDDICLEHTSDEGFPFRSEVVTMIERLRPAYLRDWQGQLGDTVQNRLAPPFARRASRYRSARDEDALYGYSIPEFLDLCSRVSAAPWVVLPSTASDQELRELGSYLNQAQGRFQFSEVLVEFGNENWNPMFGAAGIADPDRHGEVSSRAFSILRSAVGFAVPLRSVINAQFANPQAVEKFARKSNADEVAVAPYFAYDLPADADAAATDKLLFTSAKENLSRISTGLSRHQGLAIYEVNLHTIGGSASPQERDRFVLSPAAGTALAQRLMEAMAAGVRHQCVYSLSGYDTFTQKGRDLVQLFGLARDLATDQASLRPTGLAVMMLNQAVQGELHSVGKGDGVTAIAFQGNSGWSAAITSQRPEATRLKLRFPPGSRETLPGRVLTLSPSSVITTDSEVGPHCVSLTVPARGFVVLVSKTSPPGRRQRGTR